MKSYYERKRKLEYQTLVILWRKPETLDYIQTWPIWEQWQLFCYISPRGRWRCKVNFSLDQNNNFLSRIKHLFVNTKNSFNNCNTPPVWCVANYTKFECFRLHYLILDFNLIPSVFADKNSIYSALRWVALLFNITR